MENDKSGVSLMTLDTSSINATQGIMSTVPIHGGQGSLAYCKSKSNGKGKPKQLPFGSTASRVTHEIQAKPSSQISSYQQVYVGGETDCGDGRRIVPFGSGEDRFRVKDSLSPGPCSYQAQLQMKLTKQSAAKVLFPSVGRGQPIRQEERVIGPGLYNVQDTFVRREQLRSKIREKFKVNKSKYCESILNRRSLVGAKMPMSLLNENQKTCINQSAKNCNTDQRKLLQRLCSPKIDRFLLKQNTQKYLPKQHRGGLFSEGSVGCSINNNFMSSFIEKRDYAYQSYIPKQEATPGPGYYLRKQTQPKYSQSCNFKSSTVRRLFDTPLAEQKQKLKLSYLL